MTERNERRLTRRALLATMGVSTAALAGCTGSGSEGPYGTGDDGTDADRERGEDGDESEDPPTREAVVPLEHDLESFTESVFSGGVSQDGIPSIDDPEFESMDEVDGRLDDGDPVFAVEVEGDARAYPQSILVWHEIVNDRVGGLDVAVTYCPLTGTAIGFERGRTEFGVSGRLVNSNLIMYDRAGESWWPQVLGTAIDGPNEGRALREVPVIWTTWERFRETYPDGAVLTERTGFSRDYDRDPYGAYNPKRDYYEDDGTMFRTMHEDGRHGQKEVFLGARGSDGALAVEKERLREDRLLETDVGGGSHLAAYDPDLDTGYVYRNPDGESVEVDGEGYLVDGESHDAEDLPLERLNAFDAMWFAWVAFYPDTEVID
ncbi:DUF3179 domain-containing protein [Natronorarus salvus]|uniref:DUF3179 domain-containing protein n=1 Tax=Natronorarus salvus TaxID=3117733 RepID=UPI002F26B0D5